MMKNDLGIYIHIPFCRKKCDYCDFASFCSDEEVQSRYIYDLVKESGQYRHLTDTAHITTLYFGGGTPSALPPFLLRKLLSTLPENYFQAEEITFEMNPESVTEEKLRILKRFGINRISLGVQSLNDRTLQLLGRVHSSEDVGRAVALIRAAGFDNLNLDLMYGIAEGHGVEESLCGLLELAPEHISTYPLELYDHLPLAKKVKLVDDEVSVDEFSLINEKLSERGYIRYEISNFSLPSYASRHNRAYWRRNDYLGLGVSAHSLLGSVRHSNLLTLEEYHRALSSGEKPVAERTPLRQKDESFETLMLGLRLTEGVDIKAYRERFGEFSEAQKKAIERFASQNLLEMEEDWLRLTPEGMNMMNPILVALMD